MKTLRFAVLAACACAAYSRPVFGQPNTWTNTNSNFGTPGSWSLGSLPGSGDRIEFNVFGTFGTTQQFDPSITGSVTVNAISLSSTANFTRWTFTGGGTLATNSLTTYGPATQTFNGPSLSIGAGTITVTNGSTLLLTGNSTITAASGASITLGGGTLALDNFTTNTANRLSADTTLLFRSGTLDLKGNSAGTTFSVGALSDTSATGANTIRLTPGGGALSVIFNNTDASTRLNGNTVFRVEAASGVLGGSSSNDPTMTFSVAPALGANGLLASATGSGSFGYFIVKDANGTDFATYGANGVKAAGATLTTNSASSLSAGAAARVFYTPGSGPQTASSDITVGSLRIAPSAAGGVLAMGTGANAHNLATVALMLDGDKDFTITGTGTLGASGSTRYIYVNNPNTTLTTSLVIASTNSGATNIVGPGFVVLNGTSQITSTNPYRLNLLGGTLRADIAQLASTSTSSLTFEGGVLEFQNGGIFSRSVGSGGTGNVRWQGGNGGFSAFGNNATVNLTVSGVSGASMQWGSTPGFVGDGYALTFGSTKSNATLTWQNPIALDVGTAGNYLLREINVTRGAGTAADKTVMTGTISGSPSTDLIKTGTGVLELTALNSYQGNTLIQGGTLIVANSASLGTASSRTGNVVVGKGTTLAGAGSINTDIGKSVFVNPGGVIRGGNPTVDVDRLGTLAINSDLTISSTATDRGILRVEASRMAANAASSSQIAVNQLLNLNPGAGNSFIIDLVPGANPLQVGESYTITLATVVGTGNIHLNGASLDPNTTINPSNYLLQSSAFSLSAVSLAVDEAGTSLNLSFTVAPVPEPATVLGIAALLGLGAGLRRRRGS